MRVCFIADSNSIHVKRIVSHFVRKNDEILIISTSPIRSYIAGADIIHLLNPFKNFVDDSYNKDAKGTNRGIIGLLKPYIPVSFRMFAKIVIADIRLFSKRKLCMEIVRRYDPDVIYAQQDPIFPSSPSIQDIVKSFAKLSALRMLLSLSRNGKNNCYTIYVATVSLLRSLSLVLIRLCSGHLCRSLASVRSMVSLVMPLSS
jgi:hypothetical protein